MKGGGTLRKRFRIALAQAEMTQADFAAANEVTPGHLSFVLGGFRESEALTQKIEAFIALHAVKKAS